MAEQKKTLLGVLLCSALAHWFVLDGMRGAPQAQLLHSVLRANIGEQGPSRSSDEHLRPSVPSFGEVDSAPRKLPRASRPTATEMRSSAPEDVAATTDVPLANASETAFRPMSHLEVQALARVRIGLAMLTRRVALLAPVTAVIQVSEAGGLTVVAPEPAPAGAIQLCEALRSLLVASPELVPDPQALPLEIEFLP